MWKVIGLLKRPDGMGMEDFRTWWLEEHAPKVKKWPGLVKYHINLSITDDQAYDGMAEVWFNTKEEMEAIFGTPEGQTARQSATGGSTQIAIMLTEENVMVAG